MKANEALQIFDTKNLVKSHIDLRHNLRHQIENSKNLRDRIQLLAKLNNSISWLVLHSNLEQINLPRDAMLDDILFLSSFEVKVKMSLSEELKNKNDSFESTKENCLKLEF